MKFEFYDLEANYVKYLQRYDKQVPNLGYDKNEKFVCGIVLELNNLYYYAPVSSFKSKQQTNKLIYDKKGNVIASVRFSFMFPVPNSCVYYKDFKKYELGYRNLLQTELSYINKNREAFREKAKKVYEIGINKNHKLNYTCCDFKLLEQKCIEYMEREEIQLSQNEVASTSNDNK